MTFTPAAAKTISDFLRDTNTLPSNYDMLLTGDLGLVGSRLLRELLLKEDNIDISTVHQDCGLMIFDRDSQDVHSGGSGCGCCASVLCSHILDKCAAAKSATFFLLQREHLCRPFLQEKGRAYRA